MDAGLTASVREEKEKLGQNELSEMVRINMSHMFHLGGGGVCRGGGGVSICCRFSAQRL